MVVAVSVVVVVVPGGRGGGHISATALEKS